MLFLPNPRCKWVTENSVWLTVINDPPARAYHSEAQSWQGGFGGGMVEFCLTIEKSRLRFLHKPRFLQIYPSINVHRKMVSVRLFRGCLRYVVFATFPYYPNSVKHWKFVECLRKTYSRSVHKHTVGIKEYDRLQYGKSMKVAAFSHLPSSCTLRTHCNCTDLTWQIPICISFPHHCTSTIADIEANCFPNLLLERLFGVHISKIISNGTTYSVYAIWWKDGRRYEGFTLTGYWLRIWNSLLVLRWSTLDWGRQE